MEQPLTYGRKLATCLVTGLTAAATFLLLGNGGGVSWFPATVVFPLVGLSLLAALAVPVWWQLHRPTPAVSERLYAGLLATIRYLAAFNIASFGWKKVFGLQFLVPLAIAQQPINQLSGEWLTWFYFGYSPVFGLVVAGLQLLGAVLLLFQRTVLLGALVLCTVLVNLSLITICYHLNAGALVQSLVATLDALFLLGLHYRQLVAAFLPASNPTLPFRTQLPLLLKCSVVLLSLLFTVYLRMALGGR